MKKEAESSQPTPQPLTQSETLRESCHETTNPASKAGHSFRTRDSILLAGFFAQGELGPVGGQNFIHGFTASVVLFEDA